jgi:hypothetical protein
MEGAFKKRLAVIGAGLGLLASPALLASGFAYQQPGQGSLMQLALKGKKKPKKPMQEIFDLAAKSKKKEKKPQKHFTQASVMQLAAAKGKKAPKKPQTPPPPSSPSM